MNAVTQLHPEEPVNDLAAALVKAHLEINNPRFDSENPHFRNRFASLAAVRNAIIPVFAKYGLCVIQDLATTERGISCTTIILHSSGQRLTLSPLVMPVSKPDAQGYGSAATYARRYDLLAAASVAGEPDDDGNAAVQEAPAVDSKRLKIIVSGLNKAVNDKDAASAKKLWAGLTNDVKELVWNELRSVSALRASIKKLLGDPSPPEGGSIAAIAPWAVEAIKTSKDAGALKATKRLIEDAYSERDLEMPADISVFYQDRLQELEG